MTHGDEPRDDPDREDWSEVRCCRHCGDLIRPGRDIEWNGWAWHARCLPLQVQQGREQASRDDARRDDR